MAIAFFRSHALQAGPDVLSVILHLICLAKNVQTSIHLSRPFTKLHSSQCKAKAAPQPEPQPKLHSPQCTTTPLNAQPHHSVHSHTTQCTATPLSAQPQLHSPQCNTTATAAQRLEPSKALRVVKIIRQYIACGQNLSFWVGLIR